MMADTAEQSIGGIVKQTGIERVILLDSYLQGRKYVVKIDGHTAITGQNSTGKTSLIRLLPAFFGAEPSALVKHNARSQQLRFTDFYLPNRGSYVVFEYRTDQGLNLSVLTTRNDTNDLRIVLISGGYDDALFLDANDNFLDKDELAQRAKAEGRVVRSLNSITAYRGMVFGDARTRGKDHASRRFNVLAGYPNSSRFSLENVHAILAATIDSNVSIDERLLRKLLLEQALRHSDGNIDSLTRITIDIDDLQDWVSNSDGLDKVRTKITEACRAIQAADELRRLGVEEAVLRESLNQRRESIQSGISTEEEVERERTLELNQLEVEFNERKAVYDGQVDQHERRLRTAQIEKSALEERRDTEINTGIQAALELAAQLDTKVEQASRAQQTLSTLSSISEDINREIDSHIEQARAACEHQLSKIDARHRALNDETNTKRSNLLALHKRERAELAEDLDTRAERFINAVLETKAALAAAKTAVTSTTADPELIAKRDASRDRRDEALAKANAAKQASVAAKKALDDALRKKEALDSKMSDYQSRRVELEGEQLELAELLQREGTLLEFVRENVENWEESLGAVLNAGPALLYAKNLKPSLAETPQESFFGVAIDTSDLKACDVDERERERLADIEEKIKQFNALIDQTRTESEKLWRGLKELNRASVEASKHEEAMISRASSEEAAYRQAAKRAEESFVKRKEEAQKALEEAERAYQHAEDSRKAEQLKRTKELDSLNDRHQAAIDRLEDSFQQALETLQKSRDAANAERETAVRHWNDVRRQKQAEAGVSQEAIKAAEDKLKHANTQLTLAREADSRRSNWEQLLAAIDENMPKLEATIRESQDALESLTNDWKSFVSDNEDRQRACKEAISTAIKRIGQLRADLVLVGRLLDRPEVLGTPELLDTQTVAAKAELEVGDLAEACEALEAKLNSSVESLRGLLLGIERVFRKTPSPMCITFAESHGFARQVSSTSVRDLLGAAETLREFYGDPVSWQESNQYFPRGTHGARLEEVVRSCISNSMELTGFVRGLQGLQRQINQQNAAIKSHFAAMLRHLKSIDSIDVEATFDLDAIDGYRAAQRAVEAIERYEMRRSTTGDDNLLPETDMRDAFEELIKYLSARRYDKKVDLLDAVQMRFKVVRQGGDEVRESRHGESLKSAFSTGVGTIVGVVVLVGFLENMRRGLPVTIPWMLDELLKLDEANTRSLLDAMAEQRIFLMTTSPDIKAELDASFARRYALQSVGEDGERLKTPILVEIATEHDLDDPFDVLNDPEPSDPDPRTAELVEESTL